MTEDTLDTIFENAPSPLETGAPATAQRKPRKGAKRGPKATVAAPAQPTPAPARRGPKPGTKRAPKPQRATSRLKVDFAAIAPHMIGLKPEDLAMVSKITQALQMTNKKSRARIMAAVTGILS